jgi:hypothetical protein
MLEPVDSELQATSGVLLAEERLDAQCAALELLASSSWRLWRG